jgi:hypothetical protein
MYPLGYLNLLARVPAGLVENQKEMPLLGAANLFGEVSECQGENLRVDCGKDQPVDLSG